MSKSKNTNRELKSIITITNSLKNLKSKKTTGKIQSRSKKMLLEDAREIILNSKSDKNLVEVFYSKKVSEEVKRIFPYIPNKIQ